jgi:DNA-binding Xre family transcriptional regulator
MQKGSEAVIQCLKDQLKLRGFSYKQLALIWKVSESSVKRIMSSEEISLSRIESACSAMDLSLGNFFKYITFEEQSGIFHLSNEQEKLLAKDPEALNYFLLLNEGWNPTEILREYSISAEKNMRILNLLEKWGFIEVHAQNRIKRKFLGNLRFKKEGPLGRQMESIVKTEFLDSRFEKEDEYFTFLQLNFVPGDLQKIKIKLLEIFKEMTAQSDKNRQHPNSQSYGMTMAMRPWDSPFTKTFSKRKKTR